MQQEMPAGVGKQHPDLAVAPTTYTLRAQTLCWFQQTPLLVIEGRIIYIPIHDSKQEHIKQKLTETVPSEVQCLSTWRIKHH